MECLKILNWNAAGAKFLTDKEDIRLSFLQEFNRQLGELVQHHKPDFILLQEVARWGDPSRVNDLVKKPKGYGYHASIAIDTVRQAHPARWKRVREKGGWAPEMYLGQGYGVLWREGIAHCPIWDLPESIDVVPNGQKLNVEEVPMATGLYTGDRDTEPRLAIVAHFILGATPTPRDVFVVNVHLTTLKGEREGFPDRDELGSQIRMGQIDVLLRGIVARYNSWRQSQNSTRLPPIWIIAGDFNCTPESPEIVKMKRMNFLDLNPHKGRGTKGSGRPPKPEITVDYIFAGPMYWAFDPHAVDDIVEANPKPLTEVAISDHFPLVASFPIPTPRGT